MSRVRDTPIRTVVVAVMAVHSLWIGIYVATGHEARDFIQIGRQFLEQSQVSDHIVYDPTYEYQRGHSEDPDDRFRGYDGQFSYFIALDPSNAHRYQDLPGYRYSRILYPAVAWALSAGSDELLPYAMIVVNWLMVALGTIAVAVLLRRRGASPWWAAAYGLAPGMLLALQRDLTEPLAYGLAAWALVVITGDSRNRYLASGVIFALAALARQTTLLIPLVWAVWTLLGRDGDDAPARDRLRRAALLAVTATLPYVAWAAYLRGWLDSPTTSSYVLVPFGWLFEREFGLARQPPMVIAVVVPGLIAAACAARALSRGHLRPEWAALVLHVFAFVVIAPPYNAYTSVGRAVLGILLVGVLAIPYLGDLRPRGRRAFALAGALYLAMTPVVFVYGLTSVVV